VPPLQHLTQHTEIFELIRKGLSQFIENSRVLAVDSIPHSLDRNLLMHNSNDVRTGLQETYDSDVTHATSEAQGGEGDAMGSVQVHIQ
jgi:hypothetical protein